MSKKIIWVAVDVLATVFYPMGLEMLSLYVL
jgi:hypothetical protein